MHEFVRTTDYRDFFFASRGLRMKRKRSKLTTASERAACPRELDFLLAWRVTLRRVPFRAGRHGTQRNAKRDCSLHVTWRFHASQTFPDVVHHARGTFTGMVHDMT